ncbi:MAG: DUF2141 domain-containing protein [Pseudomonadota bacterium]|jgi:uncharacterized protein (DUF2141 family)|uniref:DUF2141 domain-containing protein n=1 Tax=Qipengyuania flava TaxID=192812 RepID=A0A222ER78_9SPHN|nr:DUF2141 domain-containing protein [Qipengyuania flava]KZX52205.1 hypothetical protein A3711_07805 [Erythrobacter sp. HI00D59]KZX87924.1 hypothetical protein A3719_09245 [Erythrobacter sp. HI0020]KZY18403.1 hypothetical protein A3727_16460 [Erythrobacter sp. HI0038]KZY22081.1 hypothetical protein A3726_05890 [Erythrobacter sp. HI0037]MAH15230.1 DUF2141 domain-containing protein [Sphingomonadaceae bacterium]MEC7160372.1 DUF2141 domain-containing protein [Pseudomonadota bacterium]OAN83790.1 |tara:strand:+ start:46 stop:543 length:498 start_codon:yes stop_codon:yes gene_type:complete
MKRTLVATTGLAALALTALAAPAPAEAQYRQKISNNPAKCAAGAGPAVRVTVTDIRESTGTMRVQSYRGTKEDWLEKGKWIYRMEAPAKAGSMTFCMPLPRPGTYAIAVRHDVNGNGDTDIFADGGAMSNNPSINIWNLGKPSYKKTRFDVGPGVESISIRMRYR